jgi:hypothetical protein
MDIEQMIARLNREIIAVTGTVTLEEVAHVTTFKGYRKRKDGQSEAVTIEVYDHGTRDHLREYRYGIKATSESGKCATGNGGPTVDIALQTTHWQELD